MLPPSATFGVALSDTVVVSIVSLTVVTAGAGLTARLSKPPPVAVVMRLVTEPASTYTSSPGAARLMLPLLAPAVMVMASPLSSVTVTAVCAGA